MESNGWELMTIDDVCTVTDCQHNTAPVVDYETEYRMLRTSNIRNGRLRDIESTKSVTKEIYDKWSVRGYLEDGDVILTREAPMGEVAIIKGEKYKFFLGQRLLQLKVKEEVITPEFLYYSLQTRNVQHQIMMNEGTGSVVSNIRIPLLKKIQLHVPNIDTQKRITHILDAIDSKYNNNNSMVRTLEQIAQTLFRNWFIDLEFPNEDGLPYKSSGGNMIASELGEMPYGWNVGTIGDLGSVIGGGTPSKKEESYYTENGISWITPKDLSNDKSKFIYHGAIDITDLGLAKSSAKLMPEGTVLFSSRAPIGYIAIAGKGVTTNQGFKSIVPDRGYSNIFIYFLLYKMLPTIESNAGGSTFKEISGQGLKSIEIILPSIEVVERFESVVKPLFEQIKIIEKQNKNLEDIRNALLPKLLSGEIEFPDESAVDICV